MFGGPPGIGKTHMIKYTIGPALMREHCEANGIDELTIVYNRDPNDGEFAIWDLNFANMEPPDIAVPYVENGIQERAPLGRLPTHGPAVQFIDEVTQQAVMFRVCATVVYDGKIGMGDYTVPDDVYTICAGNDETHRSGSVRMPEHFANRMRCYTVISDAQEFLGYEGDSIPDTIQAMLGLMPTYISTFDPPLDRHGRPLWQRERGDIQFASSRSWKALSNSILYGGCDPASHDPQERRDSESHVMATIGQIAGDEYCAVHRSIDRVGHINMAELMSNPDSEASTQAISELRDDENAMTRIGVQLTMSRMFGGEDPRPELFDPAVEVFKRVSADAEMAFVALCLAQDKKLTSTLTYTDHKERMQSAGLFDNSGR
tara:strand:- start:1499 stop:2620 length:1122 start_codon:yes stop_codon:yes gene_type:complete